jgi:hypothetical protein
VNYLFVSGTVLAKSKQTKLVKMSRCKLNMFNIYNLKKNIMFLLQNILL